MHQTIKSAPFYRMPSKANAVLCFLLVYSLQFLSTELHLFLHHHDKESLHSAAHEQDACHRTIYHGGKKDGCHHSTHITNKTACLLDQLCINNDHIELTRFSLQAVAVLGFLVHIFSSSSTSHKLAQLPSRAPPSF